MNEESINNGIMRKAIDDEITVIRKTSDGSPKLKLDETSSEFKEIKEEWYKQAREMTLEKLPGFMNHLVCDYIHDYGTIVHAMSMAAIASIWAIDHSPAGGITGFQADCLMWEFIKNWNKTNNTCGMRLIDFDKMMYPQYSDYFDTTISKTTWEELQKKVKEELEKWEAGEEIPHDVVLSHWKLIASGHVPFGWRVKEKEK